MLTKEQLHQINILGIEESEIERQIKNFQEGFAFANLSKPATIGDGIIQASEEEIEHLSKAYD
jgi:hypothetical protein